MWRGTEGQSVSTSSGHRGRLIRRSWPETVVLFDEAEDSTSATSTQINSQSLPAKSLREVREWGAAGRTRVAGVRLRSETSFRVLTVTDRTSCSYCNQLMLKLTLNGALWWSGNTMFNRGTEESLLFLVEQLQSPHLASYSFSWGIVFNDFATFNRHCEIK